MLWPTGGVGRTSVQTNHQVQREVTVRPIVPSWAEEDWEDTISQFLVSIYSLAADVDRGYEMVSGSPSDGSEEALAASEETKAALLCAFSAKDGKKLGQHELDSPPIFDGMIVANGQLYISTTDGRLRCMGGKR